MSRTDGDVEFLVSLPGDKTGLAIIRPSEPDKRLSLYYLSNPPRRNRPDREICATDLVCVFGARGTATSRQEEFDERVIIAVAQSIVHENAKWTRSMLLDPWMVPILPSLALWVATEAAKADRRALEQVWRHIPVDIMVRLIPEIFARLHVMAMVEQNNGDSRLAEILDMHWRYSALRKGFDSFGVLITEIKATTPGQWHESTSADGRRWRYYLDSSPMPNYYELWLTTERQLIKPPKTNRPILIVIRVVEGVEELALGLHQTGRTTELFSGIMIQDKRNNWQATARFLRSNSGWKQIPDLRPFKSALEDWITKNWV